VVATVPTQQSLTGLAASELGYVLVAGPTVWYSPDALDWTASSLPFPPEAAATAGLAGIARQADIRGGTADRARGDTHTTAVAGGPAGFIVVGGYAHEPCRTGPLVPGGPPECAIAPISWASSDGVTWQSSLGATMPLEEAATPDYREFESVWPAAGGWDGSVQTADAVVATSMDLLHTADGLAWTRLPTPPGEPRPTVWSSQPGRGGAFRAGWRILWQVWNGVGQDVTALAAMPPGGEWLDVAAFDGGGAAASAALAPARAAGLWLVAGTGTVAGLHLPLVWTAASPTGEWSTTIVRSPDGTPTRLLGLARWSGGVILVVGWRASAASAEVGRTWVSRDGYEWVPGPDVPMAAAVGNTLVASGPAGVVVAVDDGSSTRLVIEQPQR